MFAAARRKATSEQWFAELAEIRRDARRAWITNILVLCQAQNSFEATKTWLKHYNSCDKYKTLASSEIEELVEPFRTRFEFP